MKSTIYIAQEHIEVLGYTKNSKSVRILDYLFAELPERTMLNGNITDGSALVEQLNILRIRKPRLFKDVTLVIDSNSLSVKEIPVPKLNRKQYLKIARDEFSSTHNSQEELMIDYAILPKQDKKLVLMGVSASKSFIRNYLDVFNEAGIKLKAIRMGLESINSYVKMRKDFRDRTFVANIVDGFSMLSVVFSGGNSVFSTRARLTYDNEMGMLQSIANNLPPLIQFMKSEKLPDIEASYYVGLSGDQIEKLKLHGDSFACFDLLTGIRGAEKVDNTCHLSFIGIFNDGMDLLNSYKNIKKNKKEHKQISPMWLLPALVALILAAVYTVPVLMTRSLEKDIAELESFFNDPNTVEQLRRIDEISAENANMSAVIGQIREAGEENEKLGRLTNELIDLITKTNASVIIENFKLDSQGVMNITGSSDTESDSSGYAGLLTSSDLISSVIYTGYKFDSNGRYRFSLQVVLA